MVKNASFTEYIDDLKIIDPKSYEVPDSLKPVLRPYQVEGFRWLNTLCDKRFGGILADEMGLGKSVQLIALLLSRYRKPGRAMALVMARLWNLRLLSARHRWYTTGLPSLPLAPAVMPWSLPAPNPSVALP